MRYRNLCAVVCVAFASATFAAMPDAGLEARATRLEEQLRCLVCQNQSIAESQAELAMDLKRQVREMLVAGKSEAEVRDYMVARYGDFVLYDPPLKTTTLLLWLGPALLVVLALAGFGWQLARRKAEKPAPVDADALARAQALLAGKDES